MLYFSVIAPTDPINSLIYIWNSFLSEFIYFFRLEKIVFLDLREQLPKIYQRSGCVVGATSFWKRVWG